MTLEKQANSLFKYTNIFQVIFMGNSQKVNKGLIFPLIRVGLSVVNCLQDVSIHGNILYL